MKNLINKTKMAGYGLLGSVVTSPAMAAEGDADLTADLTAVRDSIFSDANLSIISSALIGVGIIMMLFGGYKWVTDSFEGAKKNIFGGFALAIVGVSFSALADIILGTGF